MDAPEDFQPPPTPGRPVSPPRADFSVELQGPVTPWVGHDPDEESGNQQNPPAPQMQPPPVPPPAPRQRQNFRMGTPPGTGFQQPPYPPNRNAPMGQGQVPYRAAVPHSYGYQPSGPMPPMSLGVGPAVHQMRPFVPPQGTRSQMQQMGPTGNFHPGHPTQPTHSMGQPMPSYSGVYPNAYQVAQGIPQQYSHLQNALTQPNASGPRHMNPGPIAQNPRQMVPTSYPNHSAGQAQAGQAGRHQLGPAITPAQPPPVRPAHTQMAGQTPITSSHVAQLNTLANAPTQQSVNAVIRHPAPAANQVAQQQANSANNQASQNEYLTQVTIASGKLFHSIHELYERYHKDLKHE